MSERSSIQDVNIELGDDVSRMLYEASTLTHQNRPGLLVEFHKTFSGMRAIPGAYFADKDFKNLWFNLGFDGVGTKVEAAERVGDHSTVAHDLFAMVCDDAVVRGAEPLAIGSILDVRKLNDNEFTRRAVSQLAKGYVEAADKADVVVVNGEVAELGKRIGGYSQYDFWPFKPAVSILAMLSKQAESYFESKRFNYNWGATVLWAAHNDRILNGRQIKAGDSLIGLAEGGFRSNGITDVRQAMLKEYGKDWHDTVVSELGSMSLGRLVQAPSTIYSSFINRLTGGHDIRKPPRAKLTGIAHITGGGQPSKLKRMLEPSGLGVTIDNPITPPKIMLKVQQILGFDDKTAYGKMHMGPGMIFATSESDKALAQAEACRLPAKKIGEVTEEPGIRIKNCGFEQKAEWLHF